MKHLLFTDTAKLNDCISLPHLPESIPQNTITNQQAFITGATGFIGGYLLKELLEQNAFEAYVCLVRAKNPEEGLLKLKRSLRVKGASETIVESDKLSVVTGDILLPQFGLSSDSYNVLTESVDHVFHFAASMNWILPFNANTVANVDALKTAIHFSASKKLKKLHYASSMGIWTLLHHKSDIIKETDLHEQADELPGGYFQSKWINEKILNIAGNIGLPINIYRIGDVKGDSKNGFGDPQNFGNLVMKYMLEKGIAVDSAIPQLNFIPVDFVARAIAYIALKETGYTFQFSNPELISMNDISHSASSLGRKIELVDYSRWLDFIKADKSTLGTTLKPIFRSFTPYSGGTPTSFYEIGMKMFRKVHDTSHTSRVLKPTDIQCPPMKTGDTLSKYLMHLEEAFAT